MFLSLALIFGLPIGYFVSLMLGSVIPFVGANDWRFLLIGVVGYPVLWFVADVVGLRLLVPAAPRRHLRAAAGPVRRPSSADAHAGDRAAGT